MTGIDLLHMRLIRTLDNYFVLLTEQQGKEVVEKSEQIMLDMSFFYNNEEFEAYLATVKFPDVDVAAYGLLGLI